MVLSLSKFFPKNTEYFYSFPAGEDSSFFNKVPAWKEELVAMRPLVCAGDTLKVVTFNATQSDTIKRITTELGLPTVPPNNIIVLPPQISAKIHGKKRNNLIKSALKKQVKRKSLVMAQPLLDKDIDHLYQSDPELTVWFNDKKNMPEYVDNKFLPKRLLTFKNGKDFNNEKNEITVPCVVKVSSSSSGDGVRICRKLTDIKKAKKDFAKIKGSIFIEEFIVAVYNLGVQFGISHDKKKPIEIIGYNQQLVSGGGEYLGAIIDLHAKITVLKDIYKVLLKNILPEVRKRGWYGVGGFDVLVDKNNNLYFIDSNFRMTAMTSYLCLIKNGIIKKSVACFTGIFKGSEKKFRETVFPLAMKSSKDKILQITAISEVDGCYHFNAALFFDEIKDIPKLAAKLLNKGIGSNVLERFCKKDIL